jgi:hypothetical protein
MTALAILLVGAVAAEMIAIVALIAVARRRHSPGVARYRNWGLTQPQSGRWPGVHRYLRVVSPKLTAGHAMRPAVSFPPAFPQASPLHGANENRGESRCLGVLFPIQGRNG